jgi:hypothetical protein
MATRPDWLPSNHEAQETKPVRFKTSYKSLVDNCK